MKHLLIFLSFFFVLGNNLVAQQPYRWSQLNAVIIFLSLGCKNTSEKVIFEPQISLTEFLKTQPSNQIVLDTIICSRKPYFLDVDNSNSQYDTIIRLAPYSFVGKQCILLMKMHNNLIEEYDLVYNEYLKWISPMGKIETKTLIMEQPKSYIREFVGRGRSDHSEFLFIADSLKTYLGKPSFSIFKGDSLMLWEGNGVALRELNSYTSTIVSFFSVNKTFDASHDWQFTMPLEDTFALSFSRGMAKPILNKLLPLKDTNISNMISPSLKYHTAAGRPWGIPGIFLAAFDTTDNLEHYGWMLQSTGQRWMYDVFLDVASILAMTYRQRYPYFHREEDDDIVQFLWGDKRECIFAWYHKGSRNIEIGRASNEYMKRMTETPTRVKKL